MCPMKRLLVAAVVAALCGCGKQSPVEEQHTVSWYMQHKEERVAKLQWCSDDNTRQMAPNCLNANDAAAKVMMLPNAKTSADGIKFP